MKDPFKEATQIGYDLTIKILIGIKQWKHWSEGMFTRKSIWVRSYAGGIKRLLTKEAQVQKKHIMKELKREANMRGAQCRTEGGKQLC